jgi:MtrB/PioB family decaheme-associated outer membrane protein
MSIRIPRLVPGLIGMLLPLAASAADNSLQFEVIGPSSDSFVFGKYNGLEEDKAYINADINWFESSEQKQWQVAAENLGLDGRNIRFTLQTDSLLSVSARYTEVALQENNTGLTPYLGSSYQVLPTTWLPAAMVPGFDNSMIGSELEQESLRKTLAVGLSKRVSDAVKLSASVALVEREGSRLTGASVFFDAANPQTVMLSEPVDHRTLKADISADFSLSKLQLTTTASMVEFSNSEDLISWQNPFVSGLGANVDYPAGIGGLSVEPDYDQQAYSISGSLDLFAGIRLIVSGAESRTEQEDALPAYTVNPLLAVTNPMPATSLDGRLETRHLNLFLLSRPMPRTTLNFKYRYRARENTASRNVWNSVFGDGSDQPPARLSLFNQPLEKESDSYEVEGGYRLQTGQRLNASYRYTETYRNYAAVEDTELDEWTLGLRSARTGPLQHSIKASVDRHAGSTYEWSRSFFQSRTVELINLVPDEQRWSNHPLLRQYHLANHEDFALEWQTIWTPTDAWQLELEASARDVDFDKSELGLRETNQVWAQLSAAYAMDGTDAWAWVRWESDERLQTGRDFSGGIQKPANRIYAPLPQGSDPSRNYDVTNRTEVMSFGFGLNWQLSEQVSLSTEYSGFTGTEENNVDVFGARDLVGQDMPDVRYRFHKLMTSVDWQVRDNMSVIASYGYFRYEDDNFAWEAVAQGDPLKLLTSRQLNPNEVVNLISIAVNYRFTR